MKLNERNIPYSELEDEIEMRLRPDEDFLPASQIIDLSNMYDMDEEEMLNVLQNFVMRREARKNQEVRGDVEEFLDELRNKGVRVDNQSPKVLAQMFLELNDGYMHDTGISFDGLQNIIKLQTTDPAQTALFEAARKAVKAVIKKELEG